MSDPLRVRLASVNRMIASLEWWIRRHPDSAALPCLAGLRTERAWIETRIESRRALAAEPVVLLELWRMVG